ncbi:DUF1284 domain-containing protein [Clostridium facile]|uniref:DUF1284 domain-containing protein n=1 Tax=Clostridium facile TaxID=2763035 RepID=A0ABR7IP43_9CLOT|nr:DUF1284 domain-containing protein [Clostridium facile]MBC5786909.1 DUF1284 domain-containing protein [Clostridium facile]
MEYKIRPHHGLCIAFFEGKGYSPEFVRHMEQTIANLKQATIQLVQGADEICSHCPNNQNGACTQTDKVATFDRRVLELCQLQPSQRITWQEFFCLVNQNILQQGKRKQVCADCEWDSICSSKGD